MEDWAKRLDMFLEFDDREILQDSGKVTAKLARPMPRVNLKSIVLCRTVSSRATLIG